MLKKSFQEERNQKKKEESLAQDYEPKTSFSNLGSEGFEIKNQSNPEADFSFGGCDSSRPEAFMARSVWGKGNEEKPKEKQPSAKKRLITRIAKNHI